MSRCIISTSRLWLEKLSRSRQDFVKEVVGKAGAETEVERDTVLPSAEFGL